MPTCPAGHDSASGDFCDVCGVRIDVASSAGSLPASPQPVASPAAGTVQPCPLCGTERSGRFCETCGFDFDSGEGPEAAQPGVPAPGVPTPGTGPGAATGPPAWTAVVASDRAYYEDVVAAGGPDAPALDFPGYCPERRFRLTGREVRIGRRSTSRGIQPEIDLTGPPADPGVSRLHAVLIAEPDGSWVVLDPGSANGTLVNGSEVTAGARVRLRDGDRIHLGAWTVITVHARARERRESSPACGT